MKKLIIAHRGAPKLAHENTLQAFKKALELGADIIEFDVRKTKDGILAIIHDPEISGRKIQQLSFFELNQIAKGQNFQVSTLEQILQLLSDHQASLQIELKESGYEEQVMETVLKFLNPSRFEIISFHFSSVKKIKTKYPQVRAGLIIGTRPNKFIRIIHFLLHRNQFFRYSDFFVIHWRLWQLGLTKLIPKNYPVTVWTADDAALIKQLLADPRVVAITSNLPDLALKLKNSF